MNIGIDARLFGPKWGGGGLGRYVEELVTELQRTDTENRYVVFLKPENAEACRLTNPNFTKVIVNAHWYGIKEQLLMPRAIKKAGVELMHYPHWNVPLFCDVPFVVTIHDLILLDDPMSAKATTLGPMRYAVKRLGYHKVLRRAIEHSQKIIAVSQATKGSILNHFPATHPDKIDVIYEGVSPLSPTKQNFESKPPIAQPYFLYVGSAYPHKNLESLLHAFSFFVNTYPQVKLVLVGKNDRFYEGLKSEVREIGIPEGRVVFTGFVPDEQLASLYEHAALYLYPSRFEGFGLPPLEAMLHGTPVASSSRGPLPEVLGDAAMYFNPDDLEQMADVMEQALTNETLRQTLRTKGTEHVKKYSWKKMAEETVAVYTEIKKKKEKKKEKTHYAS